MKNTGMLTISRTSFVVFGRMLSCGFWLLESEVIFIAPRRVMEKPVNVN